MHASVFLASFASMRVCTGSTYQSYMNCVLQASRGAFREHEEVSCRERLVSVPAVWRGSGAAGNSFSPVL